MEVPKALMYLGMNSGMAQKKTGGVVMIFFFFFLTFVELGLYY